MMVADRVDVYKNFIHAKMDLEDSLSAYTPNNKIVMIAIMHSYSLTLNRAKNVLIDLLNKMGTNENPVSYRNVIKVACEYDLIDNFDLWDSMIRDRNECTHDYSDKENAFEEHYNRIKNTYIKELDKFDDMARFEYAKSEKYN